MKKFTQYIGESILDSEFGETNFGDDPLQKGSATYNEMVETVIKKELFGLLEDKDYHNETGVLFSGKFYRGGIDNLYKKIESLVSVLAKKQELTKSTRNILAAFKDPQYTAIITFKNPRYTLRKADSKKSRSMHSVKNDDESVYNIVVYKALETGQRRFKYMRYVFRLCRSAANVDPEYKEYIAIEQDNLGSPYTRILPQWAGHICFLEAEVFDEIYRKY